jgi:predicted phosphodiesterase
MISLLVISDIHASNNDLEKDDSISWYSTLPQYDEPYRNPFHGIPALLHKEGLSADLILCPGDLADCAEPTAQEKAWLRLEDLRNKIGARRLIGTVGNHDIDSRTKYSTFDPKTTLQSLTPIFPGLSEEECDFFWSRNYVIVPDGDIRFVILNSSAFHGIHSGDPDNPNREYLNGRVSDRTIDAMSVRLRGHDFKLNLLMMHHHVYRNEHISSADYSEMKNGQALIRRLVELSNAPWLVVHGHQHYPDIFYAPGDSRSPVVISAGSMSRRLTGALSQRALNQIYHLELPVQQYPSIGWHPCGIIRSWHWTDKVGWNRTSFARPENASIPYGAGFGCRKNPESWAEEIAVEFARAASSHMEWSALMVRLPALRYVLPADLRMIVNLLREKHAIRTLNDDDGYPAQIGKP